MRPAWHYADMFAMRYKRWGSVRTKIPQISSAGNPERGGFFGGDQPVDCIAAATALMLAWMIGAISVRAWSSEALR